MLRLTLAQMRRSAGRLAAAGVAILLGASFVSVTLLMGSVIDRAFTDSAAARYGHADLVAAWDDQGLTAAQVSAIRSLPEVAAADPMTSTTLQLRAGDRSVTHLVVGTASDQRLETQRVTTGHLPTTRTEVALPVHVADTLGVTVGDPVTIVLTGTVDDPSPAPGAHEKTQDVTVTVSGLVHDPYGAFRSTGGAVVADASQLVAWQTQEDGAAPTYGDVALVLAPHATADDLRAAVTAIRPGAEVETRGQIARETAKELTGGKDVFTSVVLTFAAISLVVAALVIANTFQVLVAQRSRLLALLRCVGATKAQLARSVVGEAAVVGLLSSAAGVAFGYALGEVALVVSRSHTDLPLPATVGLSVSAIVVPVVVGTLVTVAASFVPARSATRVSPLAALRPPDAPRLARSAGAARGVTSLLLTVGGGVLLGAGVLAGLHGAPQIGLAAGVLGGAAAFVGVLVGAVFWMPRVVHGAGRLLGTFGPASRLAAANTVRNPRRTTATASALLIGVTLVAMMSTGAATASRTLAGSLDEHYPYDVAVDVYGTTGAASDDASGTAGDAPVTVAPQTQAALARIPGVAALVALPAVDAEVKVAGSPTDLRVLAITPADARRVLRDPDALDGLADGTVVVSSADAVFGTDAVARGTDTTLRALDVDGNPTGHGVRLRVVDADLDDGSAYVTPATLKTLAGDAPVQSLWLRLADDAHADSTVDDVTRALSDAGYAANVTGPAVERSEIQSVIDTLLRIVLGLLAVAVVIALIGVANTLSLSVIERRRESATLRALGLTRGQLRGMLAQEGMLIAGVGAATGLVLGLVLGWAGAAAALGATGDVRPAVPWSTLVVVLAVALVAGLVASVLPGRSAARTPPVAALAVD